VIWEVLRADLLGRRRERPQTRWDRNTLLRRPPVTPFKPRKNGCDRVDDMEDCASIMITNDLAACRPVMNVTEHRDLAGFAAHTFDGLSNQRARQVFTALSTHLIRCCATRADDTAPRSRVRLGCDQDEAAFKEAGRIPGRRGRGRSGTAGMIPRAGTKRRTSVRSPASPSLGPACHPDKRSCAADAARTNTKSAIAATSSSARFGMLGGNGTGTSLATATTAGSSG
jgi:hypothetical protein